MLKPLKNVFLSVKKSSIFSKFCNKNEIFIITLLQKMLIFKIKEIGWNLSMMRVKYKLTKRTKNTKKIEKSSKIYNITNFKTIRYKLTASGNINYSIFNYKLLRPVNKLRLPEEK